MFSKAPAPGLSDAGRRVFAAFKQAVVLHTVERITADTPDAKAFKDLLARLRHGEVTHDDWLFLMQRSHHLLSAEDQSSFSDAQLIVSTRQTEEILNHAELQRLPTAKVKLCAVNAGPGSSSVTVDDAGGLPPLLHIAQGARVMLRQNLWIEAGLTNGALGTVLGILYDPNGQPPPALPLAVFVQFDIYKGPSFHPHHANTVPIPPHTYRWMKAADVCTRTQIPLSLAFAVTIHKSQGWTCDKVRLDIGTREHSLGITYVGCSRVTSLQGLCLYPADLHANEWARFQRINNNKKQQERKAIDKALQKMHDTLLRHTQHP